MSTRLVGELRILGGSTLGAPILVGITYVGGALILRSYPGTQMVSLFLSWVVLQGLLPLLVGFLAAGLGVHEAAGELPFTWPVAYGRLALGRFFLVLGSGIFALSAGYMVAVGGRMWPHISPFAAASPVITLAEWNGCLLAMGSCAALGWGGAVLLRSAAASRVVVALVGFVGLLASTEGGTLRGWVALQLGWLILGSLALGSGWWRIRQATWALAQREEDA